MRQIFSKLMLLAVLSLTLYAPQARGVIFQGSGTEGTSDTRAGVEEVSDTLGGSGLPEAEGGGLLGDIGVLVLKYVNFLLPYLALAAFVGYVYAGVLYVANFGHDELIQKSKKILIYSTLGLIVVILSYTVVNLFTSELVQSLQSE